MKSPITAMRFAKGSTRRPHRLVLHLGEKLGESAGGSLSEELQGSLQGASVLRAHGKSLEHEELLEPEEDPRALGVQVNVAQRGEPVLVQALCSEIEVPGASGQGEGERGVSLVEDEDLSLRVAEELCLEECDESAFSCPGWSDDQGMTDVSGMKIETKGRRAPGCSPEEGWRAGGKEWIGRDRISGPDRRGRRHIGAVFRGQKRTADVRESVSGEASMKGFDCIDFLDPGSETQGAQSTESVL